MSEKKEINQEELDKVTGGLNIDLDICSKCVLGKQINIYETANYINKEILVANPFTCDTYAGTLIASWEGDNNRHILVSVKYSTNESDINKAKDIKLYNSGDPNEYQNSDSRVWLITSYK